MKNKVEIVSEAPQLNSREAARFKDFGGLMNQYNDYSRVLRRNRIAGGAAAVVSGLLLALLYYLSNNTTMQESSTLPNGAELSDSQTMGPELPGSPPMLQLNWRETDLERQREKPEDKAAPGVSEATKNSTPTTGQLPEKKEDSVSDKPSSNEFTEAAPVSGMQHLYEWLNEHIVYPEEVKLALDSAAGLLEKPVEGMVVVQFTVEADSSISNVKVVHSLGESFDKEAIRLIKSMPPWKPASRNGQPLSRSFTLPVRFSVLKTSSRDL